LKKKVEQLQANDLMSDLSEKIHKNVDNLEAKIKMLKDFDHNDIVKAAKKKAENVKDSLTHAVEEKVEEVKEKVSNKALEKLEAAVSKKQ